MPARRPAIYREPGQLLRCPAPFWRHSDALTAADRSSLAKHDVQGYLPAPEHVYRRIRKILTRKGLKTVKNTGAKREAGRNPAVFEN